MLGMPVVRNDVDFLVILLSYCNDFAGLPSRIAIQQTHWRRLSLS